MFKNIKYILMLYVLPPLVYGFITFIKLTSKVVHVHQETAYKMWDGGKNFIVCFWHGRLLMMPFANRRGKGKVLISRHRDGEFIARTMTYFSLGSIRGSYRKEGSISSLREIMSDLKKGFDVAITPDGPKGPRYKVKEGIVELARLTNKPIMPLTYSASKKKLLNHGIALSCPCLFLRLFLCGETLSI
ncbi:MAG TPA: lysophospholipid acyltransferase family protein [Syntrophorhabdaceae bacterium]|jgi:hypothetical protein|nr:lysophospholipid acyltransferase family protein [Syntrophorhabdaceae bacterium]HQG50068.1 lysophospholipid acyltransferase family protein [Syntrophorhabdaceae bacterium]HQI55853.1 lysophospholipid acyltransferase family protein [Syntrophorhabdaceae bacterium]HQJ94431.1 lysophospholipid acyltransferase family protein [Syntrophorhabdaceae bacterium]